ncbi:MAG TPA: hypothetical protein VGP53_09015 [Acidimicrobiales bacterium]|nr:hypothetical protein [Acidimicrobiales bacterium]
MDLVGAPPLGGDEPVGRLLFLGEPGHLGAGVGHLVGGVLQAGGGPVEVLVEPVPVGPACGPQDRQRSEVVPAVGATVVIGDSASMLLLDLPEPARSGGQLGGPVGGPVVPHPQVPVDLGADVPVHRVGVGDRRHRPFRRAGQSDSDRLAGGAVVDYFAAVVEGADRGGVPGVGGLAGP